MELAQVGDDHPAFVATHNALIGQLPKQPTEMFRRSPYETREIAMRERQLDANFYALKVIFQWLNKLREYAFEAPPSR